MPVEKFGKKTFLKIHYNLMSTYEGFFGLCFDALWKIQSNKVNVVLKNLSFIQSKTILGHFYRMS